MKTIFILSALVVSQFAVASNWYCTDVASERQGNTIRACGVGTGKDENEARTSAFVNAKTEFANICSGSADCKNRKVTITPQRTACEPDNNKVKCYRLIEFTILDQMDPEKLKGVEAYSQNKMPGSIDKSEVIKPFYYEQVEAYPKVYVGMSKKEALEKFGAPKSVLEGSYGIMLRYNCAEVAFCNDKSPYSNAYIHVDTSGIVTRFDGINYKYTEQLK